MSESSINNIPKTLSNDIVNNEYMKITLNKQSSINKIVIVNTPDFWSHELGVNSKLYIYNDNFNIVYENELNSSLHNTIPTTIYIDKPVFGRYIMIKLSTSKIAISKIR